MSKTHLSKLCRGNSMICYCNFIVIYMNDHIGSLLFLFGILFFFYSPEIDNGLCLFFLTYRNRNKFLSILFRGKIKISPDASPELLLLGLFWVLTSPTPFSGLTSSPSSECSSVRMLRCYKKDILHFISTIREGNMRKIKSSHHFIMNNIKINQQR